MENTLGIMTRIDQAHGPQGADFGFPEVPRPPAPEEVAVAAGLVSDRVLVQVQTQAEQLAEHLQSRQRELDTQDDRLKARGLELEHETRTFRQWASQREEALCERERALQQQAASLANHAAELAGAEQALASQRQATTEWKAQQTAELQTREHALTQQRQQLDERLLALQDAERQVAEQRQLAAARLVAERQRLVADRKGAADGLRRLHRRVQEQRTRLHARLLLLNRREVALQQLHRDVTRRHDDILESRRSAEQLWERLSSTVDQQRWQSLELQQQWTKRRQEFLRQVEDSLRPQPDDRSAA